MNKSTLVLNVYVPIYFNHSYSTVQINKRMTFFAEQIFHLSLLNVRKIQVIAYTNDDSKIPQGVWSPLDSSLTESEYRIKKYAHSDLINLDGIFEPQLLTWKHKQDLKNDVAIGNSDSLYLYIEDDAIFTQANLDYFLTFRPKLESVQLIPSFLRAEWSSKLGLWIDSDAFQRIDFEKLFKVDGSEGVLFHQPANPYCAMFLLDQDLAVEYVNSDSFDIGMRKGRDGLIWDTAASSALGLIYENVPSGFLHRIAVPMKNESHKPFMGAVVRHQGDRYANEIWWRHFRLFDSRSVPELPVPHRSLVQKIVRFTREYRNVTRKYFRKSYRS